MHAAHPHPDLAAYHARQRVAWLLEEAEHDRQVGQARRARRPRQRRRLTRPRWALAPRAVQQHACAE